MDNGSHCGPLESQSLSDGLVDVNDFPFSGTFSHRVRTYLENAFGYFSACMLLSFALRVAEALLPGSRFHRYVRDGQSIVRSSAPYSVHDEVHQHLDFGEVCPRLKAAQQQCMLGFLALALSLFCSSTVGGLHRVPPRAKDVRPKQPRSREAVHLGVTPAILRARYNLTAADVGSVQNNSQAVAQV